MCGIAGHIGGRFIAPARVDECLIQMRHRGPDHQAVHRAVTPSGLHVDLLHSRLTIIDFDARANQPFNIGSTWLIYNGELYNYVEIREALEREGVAFATRSDTEVLLRSIVHWGWRALDRFEGMWAFALYDERDGSVTLGRDRFGEKPLHVWRHDGSLYFGSEIKFLAALSGRRPVINHHQLHRYLVNGYRALYKDDHSFFSGVARVAPGTCLRIDASGEQERRYWTPALAQAGDMSRDEAVEGTRSRLLEAVRIRLRADVPLAFCMSGGVDSNSLIGIAKRAFGYDVHGFTILTDDPRYDEQEMVSLAAAELGIRHTTVPLETGEFLPRLRRMVRQHDGPVATISYFAHWLLMQQIAAHGYRIAVSGTGADELFTGYYDHHLAYLFEMRLDAAGHAAALQAWRAHVQPIVRNPFLGDPDFFVRNPAVRDHLFLDAREFESYLRMEWHEAFAETAYVDSLLRNRMLNELFHESVPVILHEDDLNAMSVSIENRSPFLDRRLFEFAASIPTRHLVKDGFAKSVLRDAMEGIVPDAIRHNRRKVGFNAPIQAFLDTSDAGIRAEILADSPVFEHVRRDKVAALLNMERLPNSRSKFLFNFLNAKVFLEEAA